MNKTINQVSKTCLEAINLNPSLNLEIGYRYHIYKNMGSHHSTRTEDSLVGHKRRTYLFLLTVSKVMHIWESCFPRNITPHVILKHVNKFIEGVSPSYETKRLIPIWDTYFDDLSRKNQDNIKAMHAAMIGNAAVNIFSVAIRDVFPEFDKVTINYTDKEIDVYEQDPAMKACLAYVAFYESKSKPSNIVRKEFWEWWINSAIPEAWNAFHYSYM